MEPPLNRSIPADGKPADFEPRRAKSTRAVERSAALSMANTRQGHRQDPRRWRSSPPTASTRPRSTAMKKALSAAGAVAKVVAPRGGTLSGTRGVKVPVDFSLSHGWLGALRRRIRAGADAESVKALKADAMAVLFVNEAYKHCKALAATGEGVAMVPNHNGATRGPSKPRERSRKASSPAATVTSPSGGGQSGQGPRQASGLEPRSEGPAGAGLRRAIVGASDTRGTVDRWPGIGREEAAHEGECLPVLAGVRHRDAIAPAPRARVGGAPVEALLRFRRTPGARPQDRRVFWLAFASIH